MNGIIFRNIRNWFLALSMVLSIGGMLTSAVVPTVVGAAACESNFLGFPAWYRGLTYDDGKGNPCAIKGPDGSKKDGISDFIWHIGLNVVEAGLVAVAYISALLTLYGGFLFITSQGKPENAARARKTMLDAVVGLLISLAAVGVVDFVITGLLK